jgi:hypothetical protein
MVSFTQRGSVASQECIFQQAAKSLPVKDQEEDTKAGSCTAEPRANLGGRLM